MKKVINSTISVLLVLMCVICLVSCNAVDKTGVWENATYRKDMSFGDGAKVVVVEVKAEDQTVTFTLNTDKDTVGAALLEHELIAGEESEYGLYVKTVNGMLADYDIDQSYWGFYIDGEYAMSGVDTIEKKDTKAPAVAVDNLAKLKMYALLLGVVIVLETAGIGILIALF